MSAREAAAGPVAAISKEAAALIAVTPPPPAPKPKRTPVKRPHQTKRKALNKVTQAASGVGAAAAAPPPPPPPPSSGDVGVVTGSDGAAPADENIAVGVGADAGNDASGDGDASQRLSMPGNASPAAAAGVTTRPPLLHTSGDGLAEVSGESSNASAAAAASGNIPNSSSTVGNASSVVNPVQPHQHPPQSPRELPSVMTATKSVSPGNGQEQHVSGNMVERSDASRAAGQAAIARSTPAGSVVVPNNAAPPPNIVVPNNAAPLPNVVVPNNVNDASVCQRTQSESNLLCHKTKYYYYGPEFIRCGDYQLCDMLKEDGRSWAAGSLIMHQNANATQPSRKWILWAGLHVATQRPHLILVSEDACASFLDNSEAQSLFIECPQFQHQMQLVANHSLDAHSLQRVQSWCLANPSCLARRSRSTKQPVKKKATNRPRKRGKKEHVSSEASDEDDDDDDDDDEEVVEVVPEKRRRSSRIARAASSRAVVQKASRPKSASAAVPEPVPAAPPSPSSTIVSSSPIVQVPADNNCHNANDAVIHVGEISRLQEDDGWIPKETAAEILRMTTANFENVILKRQLQEARDQSDQMQLRVYKMQGLDNLHKRAKK